MLLYALYTLVKADRWGTEKVYAFCSVERYVKCLRQSKKLKPITHKEALEKSSFAYLYVGEKGNENGFANDRVTVSENAIRDTWNGRFIKIELVEKCEDERYHINATYP